MIGVSAQGDFSNPTAPKGWAHRQTARDAALAASPVRTPSGRPAMRVAVGPDDLLYGGHRAELAGLLGTDGKPIPETAASGRQWLGFSNFFPAGYAGTDTPDPRDWGIVAQLHGPDALGASPVFSLHAGRHVAGGPVRHGVSVFGGAVAGRSPHVVDLAADPFADERWARHLVGIDFRSDAYGTCQVFAVGADGALRLAHYETGPTLQADAHGAVGDHYWKQGLYRGPAAGPRVDVLHAEPMIRGSSPAAVLAAWG